MTNEPEQEPEQEPGITRSDILIGSLYLVAVGINIYLIVDQATDGALSREMSTLYYRTKGRIGGFLRERREFHKAKGQVVWEAMETVNREGDE